MISQDPFKVMDARVVELVDTLVLGTSGASHPGSSPGASTTQTQLRQTKFN